MANGYIRKINILKKSSPSLQKNEGLFLYLCEINAIVLDNLFQFFNTQFPFNTEGLERFIASFETKNYKKGTIILKENQIDDELRFLDKGKIREYYANADKEMNISFYTQPEFVSDFTSLLSNQPTKKFQECLSDVQMRTLKKEYFTDFLEKYPCGKSFIDTIFQKIIDSKEQEAYKHFNLSPEELYQDLLQNKKDWLQEIPLYHIASYLRISPETLSRIRKRM